MSRIQLSEKQKQFIREAKEVWNFKIGAVRSGKSYEDVAYEIINGINERRGLAGLNVIMGVSKTTIERNVLQPMREIYTSALVSVINSQNICYIAGEPVYCIGAEKASQVAKIQGSSIKYCYGDEVAKWHRDVFEMLESRLDKPYSRFSGSANPEAPTHWLKAFIDREDIPKYVQKYVIDDNPFLPREYVERLKREYSASEVLYKRLILGEWVLSSGRVYSCLGDRPNEFIKYEVPPYQMGVIGMDFGGNGSAHTMVLTLYGKGLQYMVVAESKRIEATGLDPNDLNNEFEKFVLMCKDKYRLNYLVCYCDSAEQTLINGIRNRCLSKNLGVDVRNAFKRPIKDRINLIVRMLGAGRLFFMHTATSSFQAMSQCVYNTKEGHQDERLDDGTTDIDSVDATEYTIEPEMFGMLALMK